MFGLTRLPASTGRAMPGVRWSTAGDGCISAPWRGLSRPSWKIAVSSRCSSLVTSLVGRQALSTLLRAKSTISALADYSPDYLLSLERRLPQMRVDELGSVADATRALVAACLAPTSDRVAEAQSIIRSTVLDRARQAIQSNLLSPRPWAGSTLPHGGGITIAALPLVRAARRGDALYSATAAVACTCAVIRSGQCLDHQ